MLKFLKWTAIFLVVVIGAGALYVIVQVRSLQVERITDDLHMIGGLGGNGDHTHGNPGFLPGTQVLSTTRTLDAVLALPFTHVIPGHAALSDRTGLHQFQRFMRQLAAVGADAAAKRLTLQDTLRDAHFTEDAGYQPTEIPFPVSLNRNSVIRSAWEEATGAKTVDE